MVNNKDEWGTPSRLFKQLNREFNFTLDPCGTVKRPLKKAMLTLDIRAGESNNGLKCSWKNHRVFCNPPYSKQQIMTWVKKAFSERNKAEIIVMILPVRTDRAYFHNFILDHAEIRFCRGRPRFVPLAEQNNGSPSFGTMIIIYRKGNKPKNGLSSLYSFELKEE